MKKRVLTALLATLMIGSTFVGCGGSGSEAAAEDDGTVSGTITVGGWPSGDDAFKAAEEGFHEQYPDVTIEYNFTDTTSYFQSLQTALAAGSDADDVAMVEGNSIGQVRNSTALEDLSQDPYNADEYADDFVGLKWSQGWNLAGDRLVGLPWDIGPCTYFYRRDVYDAAGVTSDPDELTELMSTWDGVLQVAEQIHSYSDSTWFYPNASYMVTLLFMNRDYFSEEDLSFNIDREGIEDAYNAALTIRQNGWDANTSDMWCAEAYAGYADGSIASVATGAWFGGFLKTDIDPDGSGNWGITALPAGMPAVNWGGSYLVMPSQGENKAAAWAFMQYMLTTAQGQNDMFVAVDYYPGFIPAWDDTEIYEAEDPYFAGQQTKVLWTEIANAFPQDVFTTVADGNAEDSLYQSINGSLQAGDDWATARQKAIDAVNAAAAESLEQQKGYMQDAGVWNGD